MKLPVRALIEPLVGLLVLILVLQVTLTALRTSGAWHRGPRPARTPRANPYAPLDQVLASRAPELSSAPLRDPFEFGGAPTVVAASVRPPRPAPPPAPPRPVLTSIVWDADPRATIRLAGRDYSVRTAALFDEYRVVSITRDEVVLERGGESLVLRLASGEREP